METIHAALQVSGLCVKSGILTKPKGNGDKGSPFIVRGLPGLVGNLDEAERQWRRNVDSSVRVLQAWVGNLDEAERQWRRILPSSTLVMVTAVGNLDEAERQWRREG